MDFGLQGKTLIVTGGGSGIGRAICEEAGRQGMHVGVLDSQAEHADSVADLIIEAGGKAAALEVDVLHAHAVKKAVDDLAGALGPVFGAGHQCWHLAPGSSRVHERR